MRGGFAVDPGYIVSGIYYYKPLPPAPSQGGRGYL